MIKYLISFCGTRADNQAPVFGNFWITRDLPLDEDNVRVIESSIIDIYAPELNLSTVSIIAINKMEK